MSTIGGKIDSLHKLRALKRDLEEQVRKVISDMDVLEEELITQMDAANISKSTGKLATVSINTAVRPSVEDWDSFYAYVRKNNYFHLLDRRPSVSGCRELLETKGRIPGVVPYTQRKLNIRST